MKNHVNNKHTRHASHTSTRRRPSRDRRKTQSGFCLSDLERNGYQHQQDMCTVMLGLGSTGALIVDGVARKVLTELGQLPRSFDYLTIDGADGKRLSDPTKHRRLGLNGAGTNPWEGQRAFLKFYKDLHHALDQIVLNLQPDPSMMVTVPPREAITVNIVAGNGGSSGGMQQPAIMLCHDVFHARRVAKPRVNLVFLGPDMPMQDANRTVTAEQRETVCQTANGNATRAVADHMKPGLTIESPPGRPQFSIPTAHRIWGLTMLDHSNGWHQFGVTEHFVSMVTQSLYMATFTHCIESVEDRVCDLEVLGVMGRGLRQDIQ